MFTALYVGPPTTGGGGGAIGAEVSMQSNGALAAAFVSGGAGNATELVIWKSAAALPSTSSSLDVYQLDLDQPPQRLAHAEMSVSPEPIAKPIVLIGDMDASSPGSEIAVIGSDGPARPARVCVFGGMTEGGLHLLSDFHMPYRAMGDAPSVPIIGDVIGDERHAGSEIVIGGRRGRVYAVGLDHGRRFLLSVLRAFPDRLHASAQKIAVGDLLPDHPGDEIVVGDDGTVGDGLVRVFDSRTQQALMEFQAFPTGAAPSGVELWVGDVMSDLPGAELIVGQGSAGGRLSVFTLASGIPVHVLDVPNLADRTTTLHGHLAIGNLLPRTHGNEIAVAQSDPRVPVQVFNLDADRNQAATAVQPPPTLEAVTAIAATD